MFYRSIFIVFLIVIIGSSSYTMAESQTVWSSLYRKSTCHYGTLSDKTEHANQVIATDETCTSGEFLCTIEIEANDMGSGICDGAGFIRVKAHPACTEHLTHEGPAESTDCGQCNPDHVDVTGGIYSPDSGSSVAQAHQCMLEADKSECEENGKYLATQGDQGFCVAECSGTSLSGVCLDDPDPENECNADHPDFQGTIGWGDEQTAVCGNDSECPGGKHGVIKTEDTTFEGCIPDDYGPPTCDSGGIIVMDEYGFVCETPSNVPDDETDETEEPNTDTDDDGIPDEYNPDNDPNINRKQLDEMLEGQAKTNRRLGNLEELAKAGNKHLEDIESNTGATVSELQGINEKLETPEGGYSTDGLGTAPEFGASVGRLHTAFFDHPTIQAVSTLPTIGTSTSCPTYTIPSTDYWESMTMDVHCSILEDYRSVFSVMFIFFWTVVAIFLFLRA